MPHPCGQANQRQQLIKCLASDAQARVLHCTPSPLPSTGKSHRPKFLFCPWRRPALTEDGRVMRDTAITGRRMRTAQERRATGCAVIPRDLLPRRRLSIAWNCGLPMSWVCDAGNLSLRDAPSICVSLVVPAAASCARSMPAVNETVGIAVVDAGPVGLSDLEAKSRGCRSLEPIN